MGGAVLPLWLSAVAAVLTLGFAVAMVVLGYRLLGTATARLAVVEELYRLDTEQRARGQAQLVCAWPVSEKETYQSVIRRGIVGAAVRNASESPVYDVELVYHDRPAAWTAVRRVGIVPPAVEPEVHAGFDEDATDGTPDPDRVNADGTIRLAPSAEMSVELRFTDGRGARWHRSESGALTELTGATSPATPGSGNGAVRPGSLSVQRG
jgi:hypothetical protein